MSKIISIGTANPPFEQKQVNTLQYMEQVYKPDETELRKLKFLYNQSAIDKRYSVIPEYGREVNGKAFYDDPEFLKPFPSLEERLEWYNNNAASLSVKAVTNAFEGLEKPLQPTHLITVSCTGMNAPGLDLELMELLALPVTVQRTSVNFMGCYAAIHAMKMADAICNSNEKAVVLIVCTEICTIHVQREASPDNIASTLLFGDGSAAVILVPDHAEHNGLYIKDFYSEVAIKGKDEMSWRLSSNGFLMRLSGYIPDLLNESFEDFFCRALEKYGVKREEIGHWCIHPGGKRILDVLQKKLNIDASGFDASRKVLRDFGNMSSPTILFVLKEIWKEIKEADSSSEQIIFGSAFGPGLTMETFIVSTHA